MRADMFEVLLERPRRGGGWLKEGRRKGRIRRRLEEAPLREPIQRGARTKSMNENLAPLIRFLRSRAGRRWDDVHSELCRELRPTSAVQKHVLDHVRQMVALTPIMLGDVPHELVWSRQGARLVPLGTHRRHGFFVCPKSGRLREVVRTKPKRR